MARILVIEDDADFRGLVARALEAGNHSVLEAGDGVEGLKLARAESVDLIITDVLMPEQDGLGVIMALRRERRAAPIIAISGYPEGPNSFLKVAKALGAYRVMQKPFKMEVLVAVVAEALGAQPDSGSSGGSRS